MHKPDSSKPVFTRRNRIISRCRRAVRLSCARIRWRLVILFVAAMLAAGLACAQLKHSADVVANVPAKLQVTTDGQILPGDTGVDTQKEHAEGSRQLAHLTDLPNVAVILAFAMVLAEFWRGVRETRHAQQRERDERSERNVMQWQGGFWRRHRDLIGACVPAAVAVVYYAAHILTS